MFHFHFRLFLSSEGHYFGVAIMSIAYWLNDISIQVWCIKLKRINVYEDQSYYNRIPIFGHPSNTKKRKKRKLIRLLVSKSIVSFEMSRVWGIEMLTVWTSKHRQANGCKDQSKLTFSPSSKVLLMVDMVATSSICSNSSAISGFHIPRGTLAAPPSAFSREKARRFGWVIWDLVGLFSHDIVWNRSTYHPND